MSRLLSIKQTANQLGVSVSTLRRWDETGVLVAQRTPKGHRRYDLSKINPNLTRNKVEQQRKTIAYARVSSHDQKPDLQRQIEMLKLYCSSQGWSFEVISDLGSGMNYHKKGLKRLLDDILDNKIDRLVLTHKDRLLRFGAELVFALCEARQVEVVIINQGENLSFEEELAQDVLEIITVFSARLYGSRSKKNKKLIEAVKASLE
ncbi:IS607 family transposase [Psychrobacter sanguinis]|uniref:IS607 family transposase n=1 Tax=Psychrobacter sanguinis TaxID=861445 RepID=UPI00020C940D|nr:IS607 family transposase [Psychrobacter sanguinis]EGK13801.1 inosine-5'-monophosphate dehydrogenase [Psychrobacter sp. 1501(2011)]MCC3308798.1 IS607 family transposase [Psychrobacter sanguinis]MCD9150492.1 IS607 family transposase [Psychrobacter sanguinis]